MYTRQEASRLRQEFWTAFGQYMSPVLSADGEKVNWVNYKTGIKGILFRMEAGNNHASISVEFTNRDDGTRRQQYRQFLCVKNIFQEELRETWTWEEESINNNGQAVNRIFKEIAGVNVFKKDDWPALISFFKPRLVALDAFWSQAKYSLL